ncbi:hypothetical protein GQ457_08G015110 [Hibiscus cannabinus]
MEVRRLSEVDPRQKCDSMLLDHVHIIDFIYESTTTESEWTKCKAHISRRSGIVDKASGRLENHDPGMLQEVEKCRVISKRSQSSPPSHHHLRSNEVVIGANLSKKKKPFNPDMEETLANDYRLKTRLHNGDMRVKQNKTMFGPRVSHPIWIQEPWRIRRFQRKSTSIRTKVEASTLPGLASFDRSLTSIWHHRFRMGKSSCQTQRRLIRPYFDLASSGSNGQITMANSASVDQSLISIWHHRVNRLPTLPHRFDRNLISDLVSLGTSDQTTVADSTSFDQSITFDLASLDTNEHDALTGSTSFDQGLTFDLMPLCLNGQVTIAGFTHRLLQERRFSSRRTRHPSHISLNLSFFELGDRKSYCFRPEDHIHYRESFDLASSGSKEQTKHGLDVFGCEGLEFSSSGGISMWRPSVQRSKSVIVLQFGQIKIGVSWSLPYSRFSVMCKEGQL